MTMASLDDVLPSASDVRKILAEKEAEKAAEFMRRHAAVEAKKKELLEKFEKPSGVADEDRMKRAAAMINQAMSNGLMEVEVGRFPNTLCSDRGRAINQQEAGWEDTLLGLPKELFGFWKKHLQPKGYRIKCQIADWPNGMPGDFSMTLSWGEK
jgi:hypothetical protein